MTDEKRQLESIKCFLMDMDGTIYLGDQLLPGVQDWLDLLEERGVAYYFLTNNSSRSSVEYADKLGRFGLVVPEEKIFTSGEATAIYSAKQNTPQLAAWVPCIRQNLIRRRKFRNAPSACGGDKNFQGFAS